MNRGDLFLVQHPSSRDPRKRRAFVVVSRQLVIDSAFSTVVCAPVYTRRDGLKTQVDVGPEEGLEHDSSIHCDELMSLPKTTLTNYLGSLSLQKRARLDQALAYALGLAIRPGGSV